MSEQIIAKHLPRFIAELTEWLRIPSISADPVYKASVTQAAQWLADHLKNLGAHDIALNVTAGHPIVTARLGNDPKKPTVLVYGHYDVQPPDPLELWTTPAFEPEIRDGKMYARGVSDDKGQVFMHVKAAEMLQAAGEIPCNILFLIEGEEECGSTNLETFVIEHRDALKCDAVLISDTSIIATDIPSLTVGLRGLAYIEVTLTGANRDLHSGIYGGNVGNPIHALSKMIAQLHDEKGRVTVPGFYDRVRPFSAEERKAINEAPFNETEYKQSLAVKALQGEEGYSVLERVGIRPCLDCNGIWGGYTGEGAKTVLPSKAHAKISMRLVADQNHDEAADQLIAYLEKLVPPTMTLATKKLHGGPSALTRTDGKAYKAAFDAFGTVWNKTPIPMYEGGSIPIVSVLSKNLGVDVVLMGFGLDSNAIHSPNEHFDVAMIPKGIAAIMQFHKNFAKAA
jgi:acetylornithine deacetylase/succinyl-diaminopimelate desuccinylase-like protein